MLSKRYSQALVYAEKLHRTQTRKGNSVPYIAHLLSVSAQTLEWGADEDVAIAALLHDAVEDQGGLETAAEIRERFGERVEALVLACSDSTTKTAENKLPWADRKTAYVAGITSTPPGAELIILADKLHNIGALLEDIECHGADTLKRFSSTPAQMAWYFDAVAEALATRAPARLVGKLQSRVAQLKTVVKA